MKNWVLKNKLEILLWLFLTVFLSYIGRSLLSSEIIAGWDTTPHFYLFTKMVEFMKNWQISGYDMKWFNGYPVFTFYGPLPYILLSGLYFLSFGLLGLPIIFNLFLFFLPFLFLLAVFYSGRIYFGKNGGIVSLIFGFFFLASAKTHAYLGMGINSVGYLGLFANLFAISLMIFLLGIIEKHRNSGKKIYLILAILLWAGIILSHSITAIFTAILLFFYTVFHFKQWWKSALIIFFSGIFLSSFWLIPFLQYLNFSSGQAMGVLGFMVSDPLFALYPKLHLITQNLSFEVLPGIFLFIFSLAGLIFLLSDKEKRFLAFCFLFTLIFLPREYLINFINLGIHYFRFIPHIFVLNIFLATAGFLVIWKKLSEIRRYSKRFLIQGLIIYLVVMSLIVATTDNYNHQYRFENYPETADAKAIMEFISTLDLKGKIIVNTSTEFQERLGSPHFFSSFIPLQYGIEVFPGLLAESAFSTRFLMPTTVAIGSSLVWGDSSLAVDPEFFVQNKKSMLKRLALFNMEYILTTKSAKEHLLAEIEESKLQPVKEIGDFSLLKIVDFKPFLEEITYKPFLFVDKGGMDFSEFTKEWYKDDQFFNYPVIYTQKELSTYEEAQIGGYIVSMPFGTKMDVAEYQKWTDKNTNLIFLNAALNVEVSPQENSKFIEIFGHNIGRDFLKENLRNFDQVAVKMGVKSLEPISKEDEHLKFQSNQGVLINASYFPRWKSVNEEQNVFWATPSMMFVFSQGETELYYD